eukprot:1184495-Prorocentrum_minimum.AAC.1
MGPPVLAQYYWPSSRRLFIHFFRLAQGAATIRYDRLHVLHQQFISCKGDPCIIATRSSRLIELLPSAAIRLLLEPTNICDHYVC